MDAYNQTMFWRREAHDRCGAFDENLHKMIDNDMIIRFLGHYGRAGWLQLDEFLGAFRIHAGQKTDAQTLDPATRQEIAYLENKFGFYPKRHPLGIYFRLKYRVVQLGHAIKRGGPKYAWEKFLIGWRRKHNIL